MTGIAMSSREIRNLLLDCRTALRKADGGFERSALCAQLDRTLIGLRDSERREREEALEREQSVISHRVAYTWQGVARELRRTHPELHEQLSQKVLQRLGGKVPDDAAEEIEALRAELRQREDVLAQTAAELDALRTTLAAAVPLPDAPGRSEAELARERVQALLQAALQGGGLTPSASVPESTTGAGSPTRVSLQAVAEGRRPLTNDEREWCVGEAMVLTGFQKTPVQLLEQGDAELVRVVLAGMALHA